MEGELSLRLTEIVELRSQLDAARAEKDNALAEAATLRAAAAAPATETAVPDPTAPGPSGQQDSTEARIVAAVAAIDVIHVGISKATRDYTACSPAKRLHTSVLFPCGGVA